MLPGVFVLDEICGDADRASASPCKGEIEWKQITVAPADIERADTDAAVAQLRVIPLGGLGGIGKNMMLLESGENILIIDAGLMFPDSDMHGVDVVIPRASTCSTGWTGFEALC